MGRVVTTLAVLGAVAVVGWAGAVARAQDNTDGGRTASERTEEERQRARNLFEDARAAFEAGRFVEARELLHESLELWPHAPTAINLARVLRAIGEPLGAERVLQDLQNGGYGALDREQRQNVAQMTRQVRGEIARLELTVRGADRTVVRIDGVPEAELDGEESHGQRIDPGSHVILASTPDGRTAERRIEVEPGSHRRLSIDLPARTDRSRGLLSSPWFWAVTGAVVVGAGVTAGVLLSRDPRTKDPVVDPVWGVAEALREP